MTRLAILITMFLFSTLYADLTSIDNDFLNESNSIITSSLKNSGTIYLNSLEDLREYNEISDKIKSEINDKIADAMSNNTFNSATYNKIVNDAFNEAYKSTESSYVKYKLGIAKRSISNSFSCACSGALSSAFSSINRHLFDERLYPFESNLKNLLQKIQNTNEALLKENKVLLDELKRMKLLVLKSKNYLFELKKASNIKKALK